MDSADEKLLRPNVNFSAKETYGIEVPVLVNTSVNRYDYKGDYAKRPDPIHTVQDFPPNILVGPYDDPLLPDTLILKNADPSSISKAEDIFNKFTSKYPSLKKKALQNFVDQTKIMNEYEDIGKSMYQKDYCKPEPQKKPKPTKGRKTDFKLPNDWVVPLSVQGVSYRDTSEMKKKGLLSFEMGGKPFRPGPNNLGFTAEEHEILKTTTGETDYQEIIGTSGRDILKEEFYGVIAPLPREYRHPKTEE